MTDAERGQAEEFTQKQVLDQAMGNLVALILGTCAYLKERHQSPAEWSRSLGARFAPGWDSLREQGALAVARAAALNAVSSGAKLVALTGDASRAEARISWPLDEAFAFFGGSYEDIDAFLQIFVPIAERMDLRYQQRREGGEIALTFAR